MERGREAIIVMLVNLPLELVDSWPLATNSSQNSLASSGCWFVSEPNTAALWQWRVTSTATTTCVGF